MKIVISILIATFIQFTYNAASWMIVPLHNAIYSNLPYEIIDSDVWQASNLKDGVYHYPGLPDQASSIEEIRQRLAKGPRITYLVIRNDSSALFSAQTFLFNLLFNGLTSILIIFLLQKLKDRNFKNIFQVCLAIGLLALFMKELPFNNWHMVPVKASLISILDMIILMTLLSLFFARYTFRPQGEEIVSE